MRQLRATDRGGGRCRLRGGKQAGRGPFGAPAARPALADWRPAGPIGRRAEAVENRRMGCVIAIPRQSTEPPRLQTGRTGPEVAARRRNCGELSRAAPRQSCVAPGRMGLVESARSRPGTSRARTDGTFLTAPRLSLLLQRSETHLVCGAAGTPARSCTMHARCGWAAARGDEFLSPSRTRVLIACPAPVLPTRNVASSCR